MDDIFVGQFMSTPVLTIDPETTLADAASAMTEEGIKSVVAIDDDCLPKGILTSTDFVRAAAAERSPTETAVSEYMATDVQTISAGASLRDVAELMRENDVSHVPVVEDDGTVIGIVTATDLTAYISGMAELAVEA